MFGHAPVPPAPSRDKLAAAESAKSVAVYAAARLRLRDVKPSYLAESQSQRQAASVPLDGSPRKHVSKRGDFYSLKRPDQILAAAAALSLGGPFTLRVLADQNDIPLATVRTVVNQLRLIGKWSYVEYGRGNWISPSVARAKGCRVNSRSR